MLNISPNILELFVKIMYNGVFSNVNPMTNSCLLLFLIMSFFVQVPKCRLDRVRFSLLPTFHIMTTDRIQ